MPTLSDAQIAGYAAGAGWSGTNLPTAVAVALAESGGNPDSVGDVALETSVWGPSVGLWQIRSYKAQRGTGQTRDELANHDPATNARNAHTIQQSAGWGAWTTYNTGAYRGFMSRATAAAGNPSSGGVTTSTVDATTVDTIGFTPTNPVWNPIDPLNLVPTAGGIAGALEGMATGVIKVMVWGTDRNNWVRVARVLIGGALLIGGLVVIARPVLEPAVDKATELGGKVAKAAVIA